MSEPTSRGLDERVVEAAVGHLEMIGIYLGRRLGLYTVLAEAGPLDPPGLAAAAGITERYAREWLEQQAIGGYLTVEDPDAAPRERRFHLDSHQRAVLVDADDPAHVAPLASMTMGIASVIDQVVAAYRTGEGVPWSAYGSDMREGQGGINRPAFTHDLVGSWLPAVPTAHEALASGRPVRVLDVGTGQGWAAVAVAAAYPNAEVIGIDVDTASVEDARRIAAERGVNVRFEEADAAGFSGGPVDLALVLEVLHDLARPTEALRALRRSLSDDGVVLVADEAVPDSFAPPGDMLERMMYGWSIAACLPNSMSEPDSEAIGTPIRPATVERIARDAGFSSVERVDADGGFFHLYALRP